MIAAYDSTLELVSRQVHALGADHAVTKQSIAQNWTSLCQFIRSSTPSQSDVASFIDHLRQSTEKKRGCFSSEQTASLIEAASTAQLHHGSELAVTADKYGQQKEQKHLFSFRYYSEAVWSVFLDKTAAMPKKRRVMFKEWLDWGLIFPSAPTMRIGLATLLVAMDMHVRARQGFEMFCEFRSD